MMYHYVSGAMEMRDMKMSKDISITALATDEEINQLWEIVGEIIDRNNIDNDSVMCFDRELSVKLLADRSCE